MQNYIYHVKSFKKLNKELKRVCACCGKKLNETYKRNVCPSMCKSYLNGTRVKFNCEYCGRKSTDKATHYNKVNHHFCSKECRYKWQKNNLKGNKNPNWQGGDVYCKCDYCKKDIHMKKYEYNNLKHHFCNKECYVKWLSEQESFMKGKHHSLETKNKLSKIRKDKIAKGEIKPWNKGKKCPQLTRENNPNWNPNLTDEERVIKRKYKEYEYWRTEVFKKYNYTCQLSHQKGGQLVVHHLNGYGFNKEQRLDINNGIVITKELHILFHKLYGNKNNTKEQFEEFKQRYINKEFEEVV